MVSEFLGQVGCLVRLGDVLKAALVCSQDIRFNRDPAHCLGLQESHLQAPWPGVRNTTCELGSGWQVPTAACPSP